MLVLQRDDFVASLRMRQSENPFELLAEFVFPLLVEPGPSRMIGEAEQVARTRMAQDCGDALVQAGRVAEAAPDLVPFAAPVKQRVSGNLGSIAVWVETELTCTDVAECRPATCIATRLEAIRVAHPTEQIPNRVADGQPVEIVGFQPPSAQASERL